MSCTVKPKGSGVENGRQQTNRPFPSFFEPHYEYEVSCIVFIMNSSFISCKQN